MRSIRDRLKNNFNISIAEVAAQDHRQLIELGIAVVDTEANQARSLLQQIVNALRDHPIAELVEQEIEV